MANDIKKKETTSIKLDGVMIGLGITFGAIAYKLTPSMVGLLKKTSDALKTSWPNLKLHQKVILGLLASGQIIPYLTIAFVWYINQLNKESKNT